MHPTPFSSPLEARNRLGYEWSSAVVPAPSIASKGWQGGPGRTPWATPFEEITNAKRWDLYEEKMEGFTFEVEHSKTSVWIGTNDLDPLRLHFIDRRRQNGCCRTRPVLLESLDDMHYALRYGSQLWKCLGNGAARLQGFACTQ